MKRWLIECALYVSVHPYVEVILSFKTRQLVEVYYAMDRWLS